MTAAFFIPAATDLVEQHDWLPLDALRETAFLDNGKVILVKPIDKGLIVPFFCPLCTYPMRTADDSMAFRNSGVCNICDLRWLRPYSDSPEWAEGKLPKAITTRRWRAYHKERSLLSKPLMSFQ